MFKLKKCVMKDSHLSIEVWTRKDKPGYFATYATQPGEYTLIDKSFDFIEHAKSAAIDAIWKEKEEGLQ